MAENNEAGDAVTLTEASLGDVLEETYSAVLKWYNIGLRLGLQAAVLDAINVRCNRDPEVCLREMLKEWLKRAATDTTYRELVRALRSTAVGEGALASKLTVKYSLLETEYDDATKEATEDGQARILEDDCEVRHKHSASFSDPQSSDASKELTTQRPFGCGCGRCSLSTFLDRGCPQPVKSHSAFPYLQTAGLSKEEVVILEGRLYGEFQLITRNFSTFNTAICESLIEQEVTVKRLARVLRDLRAFQPLELDTPLLRDRFEEIKVSKDIDDVFDILADYVSFFSFHITVHIVEVMGTDKDRALLAHYKKQLEEYCKRNIFECPSYSTPKPGVANLVMKVEGIEKNNMKHLAELISHISRAISVSQHALQLCSVDKGCVQLNFQISHFVKEAIFPLATEQKEKLREQGVILLKCDKWKYELQGVTGETKEPEPVRQKDRAKAEQFYMATYSHGPLPRLDSEIRLLSAEHDCFLLRKSESRPECLTLSVKQKGKLMHILVEDTEEGYVPHGEITPFQSLGSLIDNVMENLPPCLPPRDPAHRQRTVQQGVQVSSHGQGGYMSDYESDYSVDNTGDNTADWTGGTGDSAIVLAPPPIPPKHTGPRYEKINSDKRDKEHQYSKVKNPDLRDPPDPYMQLERNTGSHQAQLSATGKTSGSVSPHHKDYDDYPYSNTSL